MRLLKICQGSEMTMLEIGTNICIKIRQFSMLTTIISHVIIYKNTSEKQIYTRKIADENTGR